MTIAPQNVVARSIAQISYPGASRLAEGLKVAAFVIAALGVLATIALASMSDADPGARFVAALFSMIGTLVLSVGVAFMGYLLDVLLGIFTQTWEARFPTEE